MKTVYIDAENKCHMTDDGTMTAVDTAFFDGKCDDFTEGYCLIASETGITVYPWRPYGELEQLQRRYEQTRLRELETLLDELYTQVVTE